MLKKIIIGIVAAVVLTGVGNLIAEEKRRSPKTEQKQEQLQKQKRQKKQKCPAEKKLNKKAGKKAGRKYMKYMPREHRGLQPGRNQPVQERFDRWFEKLIKAYRQNDREKMGQLLRNMNQAKQKPREVRGNIGERRQGFHKAPGMGRRGKGFYAQGMGRQGRGFRRGRMGGGGRGFRHGGMNVRRGHIPPGPALNW